VREGLGRHLLISDLVLQARDLVQKRLGCLVVVGRGLRVVTDETSQSQRGGTPR
jgi:hypothetical protein